MTILERHGTSSKGFARLRWGCTYAQQQCSAVIGVLTCYIGVYSSLGSIALTQKNEEIVSPGSTAGLHAERCSSSPNFHESSSTGRNRIGLMTMSNITSKCPVFPKSENMLASVDAMMA